MLLVSSYLPSQGKHSLPLAPCGHTGQNNLFRSAPRNTISFAVLQETKHINFLIHINFTLARHIQERHGGSRPF
jgi:hypothetical protein